MAYAQGSGFRGIVWLVLVAFYVQTLNPAMLGYAPLYGAPPTRTETAEPSAWQRLLDFVLPAAQAAEPRASRSSAVFRYREYVPAYARPQATDDPLLMSTPEFDLADPYLVAKANELGKDPQRIFAFVRDEIGFESYTGSLRGARGALWSKAGNALDKASLMIALLRISGVPARYVQGTLTDDRAKELILSMFPSPTRVVGCPPENAVLADPANDPQLLAETRQHYWVEFGSGGFTVADPNFKDAQLGQPFTGAQGNFAEVPDNLRHKVTVRLKVEFPAGIAGTAGLQVETPLSKSFTTVELVGKPLSIGHFVNSFSPPALLFGYTTHTYSPYILIAQYDSNIADDEIVRGEDYQEFFSNFPISNQFLTGLFLEVDVIVPNRKIEKFERILIDRIGFSIRQNGGQLNFRFSGDQNPALSDLDLVTINVLPGLQSLEAITKLQDRASSLQSEFDQIKPLIEAIPSSGPQNQEQLSLFDKALSINRQIAITGTQATTMVFAGASDEFLTSLEKGYLTKAYYVSPRLLMSITKKEGDNLVLKIDLRKNDLRTAPLPGQVASMGLLFEYLRGLMESTLEGEIVSQLTGKKAVSMADIFGNMQEGNSLVLLSKDNLHLLDNTTISETAGLSR